MSVSTRLVLPAPFGPTTARRWPRSSVKPAPATRVLPGTATSTPSASMTTRPLRSALGNPNARWAARVGASIRVDAVEPLLARGRLARAGPRAEALDEALEARDLGGLELRLGPLAVDGQGPLAPEGRVAHRPQARPAAVELQHAGRQRLQEPPVVGHEHDRRAEVADGALQPLDRAEVEVVGGLVQQQHVRLRHQGAGERRPRQLAAREAGQRPRQVLLGDPETAQDALHPRAPGVAARALQARLGLLVRREHRRAVRRRRPCGPPARPARPRRAGRRRGPRDVLLERQVGAERAGAGRGARRGRRAAG